MVYADPFSSQSICLFCQYGFYRGGIIVIRLLAGWKYLTGFRFKARISKEEEELAKPGQVTVHLACSFIW